MSEYQDFLKSKLQNVQVSGFEVEPEQINPMLFKFQNACVRWAVRLGKAALFEECGLGKTFQQIEWARLVAEHTGGKVLILAPLAVAGQTVLEAKKLGVNLKYVANDGEMLHYGTEGVNLFITNYDRLHLFDTNVFSGVVLDESSILKSFMGKTKQALFEAFARTPYKLCCTATPAPNDHLELGNHAAFLDVMPANEMISRWFINDTMEAGNYRLKKHAAKDFWRWLTSWAVCLSEPKDLGAEYDETDFILPPLNIVETRLSAAQASIDRAWSEGRLIPDDSPSSTGMHKVKRESLEERVANSAQIVYNKWATDLISNGVFEWLGNQNTTKTKNESITLIQNTESVSNHSNEHLKKTKSTCETTTLKTKRSSKNISKTLSIKIEKTLHDESDTQTIPNTENNVNHQPEVETSYQEKIMPLNLNSELELMNITQSSNPRMDVAPYAEQLIPTSRVGDSMLITIMKQGLLEDCSAQTVIQVLVSLKTIPNYLPELLNTSLSNLTQFIIWCDTDYEQRALEEVFGDYAFSVYGSLSNDEKESRIYAWLDYEKPILISKPSILGYGMNFQQCSNQVMVGVSYSFEKFYQAVRRSWRFGQQKPVQIDVIYAETEGNIMTILKHKQQIFKEMQKAMSKAVQEHGLFRDINRLHLSTPQESIATGDNWTLYLGDCVEQIKHIPDNSIHFGIHSPPFSSLYIYSDSEADMGNSADDEEFFKHYEYLIEELYRTTMPGRLCAVHCKDLPSYMNRDGAAGLVDFPGMVVRAFEAKGWQYHSRVTIWKDPVIEMTRTKNHGLLHKNFVSNAEACRQGMPDYLVVFRKWPLEGGESVKQYREVGGYIGTNPPDENAFRTADGFDQRGYSIATWQKYASPVWMDINQTNVLNGKLAKSNDDSKHICPLQLDVIERCVDLWSNKGETIFSPFAGIGSEGYSSIKLGRKFIGIELKESYWKEAQKFLNEADVLANQPTMFDLIESESLA